MDILVTLKIRYYRNILRLSLYFKAFALFPQLLDKLHGLEWDALQEALAIGMLAGNVFDWGAKVR